MVCGNSKRTLLIAAGSGLQRWSIVFHGEEENGQNLHLPMYAGKFVVYIFSTHRCEDQQKMTTAPPPACAYMKGVGGRRKTSSENAATNNFGFTEERDKFFSGKAFCWRWSIQGWSARSKKEKETVKKRNKKKE